MYTRMSIIRRGIAALSAVAFVALTAACGAGNDTSAAAGNTTHQQSAQAFTITDVKGRNVSFDAPPQRIILAEGRNLFATNILNPTNPAEHIVAMGNDVQTSSPSYYEQVSKRFPQIANMPTIGGMAKGDVTVEHLLSLQPDVVMVSADHYDANKTTGMMDAMDKVGLHYVVTDFRQHPLTNTTRSMEIFGKILGREAQAQQFNQAWNTSVKRVTSLVASAKEKPLTFLWRAAGLKDCCSTVKASNFGEMITMAGGTNLGDKLLKTPAGDITAEAVIANQPQVIIATGGSWAVKKEKPETIAHVELGYGATPETAARTLRGLLATPGFSELKAPKDGKLFGVWHQFYDSPFNFVALEQFAAWIHPEFASQLKPEATWKRMHEQYMPFTQEGVFFTSEQAGEPNGR